MKSEIERLLKSEPQLKARQIAKKLGQERKNISVCLHNYPELFSQNKGFEWSIVPPPELRIEFPSRWVDRDLFEKTLLQAGCPISSPCQTVVFIMPHKCAIMLEASARILALCNQLKTIHKKVILDFTENANTLSYLNRCGFIDQLHKNIDILPKRPKYSRSKRYSGESDNLIEVREINQIEPDEKIPEQLANFFVSHASGDYYLAAFTFFSELVRNVCDHSATDIPGFAALQVYGGHGRHPSHIQTVISDSGIGILASLKPILRRRYPQIASDYDLLNPKSGLLLIKRMFQKGGITSRRRKEGDGGLGLQSSHAHAKKFNAKISIRQETSELTLNYIDGESGKNSYEIDLPKIRGTQVCFDFALEKL